MRRWIALALTAIFVFCLSAPAAAQSPSPGSVGSWEALGKIEAEQAVQCPPQAREALAAAYAQAIPRMIQAVQAAPDYVPGSLERHGDFFFWRSTDGRANGYSPSLRAELARDEAGTEPLPSQPHAARSETDNIPETRDVGVFIPYSGSYYFYPENCIREGQRLARSTGGSLQVYTAENATVDNLASALSGCGILLINSHGRTDYERGMDQSSRANSSYICLPSSEGVTEADQRPVNGPYGTYYHAFYAGPSEDFDEEYYCVDGTCIANHMGGQAPHSMVWLGLCLGMATEGLYAPLRQKGVEALIGFSEAVTTNADHEYRGVFVNSLLEDCTVGQAAEAMKAEVGCPDPYQTVHDPAYPIAVSGQDPYPGRSHLAEGQEVQSTWKLHPAYPIRLSVDPPGSAELRLVRTELEILPARGYRFESWELTGGEAEVERKQNHLSIAPAGPCAISLHMAARTPACLRFFAGPGQEAEEIQEFLGDTVLLPAPEGELEADAYVYHFLGWSREPLEEDSPDCPPLLKAGSRWELTEPETELWAVYGYFVPEDGVSRGQFRLVDREPEDWAGDYVLSYQSTKALRASRFCTGQAIITPSAVATDQAAGYFVDGDWLNEVPEEIVYSFLPDESGAGALKMKTSDNYLAIPSSSVMLSTVTDPRISGAAWNMSWSEGVPYITNARFRSRILQYSLTSSGFCTLSSLRCPLTLYVRVPGVHRFTTQPLAGEPEPNLPCHGGQDCPGRIFTDMPPKDCWAHDPIDWAVSKGIAAGTGNGLFGPEATCTRAQNVMFLWRAAGSPSPEETDCPFTDVSPDAYYRGAVLWASQTGISAGTGENRFSPDAPCTREQIITLIWRFAGSPEPEGQDCPFTDLSPESYSYKPILWAYARGVSAGTGATVFSPGAVCSRAQIVTFLYRACRE